MKPDQSKSKPPVVERFLDARGVAFVSKQRAALVTLAWVLTRGAMFFMIGPVQDVKRYFDCAGAWLQGLAPYEGFILEYPPGSLILFALPRFLTDNFMTYTVLFCLEMMCIDLVILALVWRISTHVFGSQTGSDNVRRYDVAVAALFYIILSGLLEPHTFQRYDMAASALMLGWLYATLRGKPRGLPELLLAMGIWIKLVPAILIPIYLFYHLANALAARGQQSTRVVVQRWVKQSVLRVGGIALGTLLLTAGFLAQMREPYNIQKLFDFHTGRGLQIESSYASIFLFLQNYFGVALRTAYTYGATEIKHDYSQPIANISFILSALWVAAVSVWFGYRMLQAKSERDRNFILIDGTVAVILTFIIFTKVFSPQYLLWVAPLAPLVALHDQNKTRHWLLGFTVTFFLSAILLMFYYVNLIMMERFPVSLLLARNALVIGLIIVMMELPRWRRKPEDDPLEATMWASVGPSFLLALSIGAVCAYFMDTSEPRTIGIIAIVLTGVLVNANLFASNERYQSSKLLGYVRRATVGTLPWAALIFAGLWCFCANLSETTANDIWIQLRYGDDLIRTGVFPETEVYSATVSGRPFIAHEWLASVVFSGVTMLFGNGAISILTAAMALACFVLMYFAVPKEDRQTPYALLVLVALSYLVSFRVLVRPHIFSLVAYCAFALAIERWRRKGGLRELLWLVPVQLLWVNMHGAALIGPCFIGLLGGCVGLMVLFPALQMQGSETREFTWRDVSELAITVLCLAIACLVNPYGSGLITFSIDLFNNPYAKERVWEWTAPLIRPNFSYYWMWLYVCILLSVWAAILVRLKTVPLIDLAFIGLMTFFSLRANRFVPDLAIFAYPVICRSMAVMVKNGMRKDLNVRFPWVEIGFLTLLFSNVALYGFAHSAREHRPQMGWGFGGDMPYQETQLLKKLNIKGVIFNEYSDGALIIHDLYPQIRPVLDSRIDLYPLDIVGDYDRAYTVPDYFPQYLKKNKCNVVLVYKNRSHPLNVRYLMNSPEWTLLLDTNNRLLFAKRPYLTSTAAK